MSITYAFLAECPGSPTIEEQKAALNDDDCVVVAGRHSFTKLGDLLARRGVTLSPGDRIKVYDLSCVAISTTSLLRALSKMLRRGIGFEIVSPGIVITPSADDQLRLLLGALDGHHRHVHGIKTHPADAAPQGRKRLLDPDQLPEIRRMLDQPGATASSVAIELGVARSTLFNFLERCGGDRQIVRGKQRDQRPA